MRSPAKSAASIAASMTAAPAKIPSTLPSPVISVPGLVESMKMRTGPLEPAGASWMCAVGPEPAVLIGEVRPRNERF